MPYSARKRAAIVGAGPVGCLAAEVLAGRGYHVDLYDKRTALAKVSGGRTINLSINPRGMAALDRFGAGAAVREASVPIAARAFHPSDQRLSIEPYGKPDWITYSVGRDDLNRALLELVQRRPEVRIHGGQACLHADLNETTLTMRGLDGRVKTVMADLIVGADGVASAVRSALIRVPRTNFAKIVFQGGYRELTLRSASGDFPFCGNAIHIWPRGDFFMVALPNRDRTLRGTLVLSHNQIRELRTADAIGSFFEIQFPDALSHLAETPEELLRRPMGEIVTVRCEALHYGGAVLLLGDAAHAVVPFMGQGVNIGLEDCAVLDGLLDQFGDDLAGAFAELTERRLPEGLACADLSEWNFRELTSGRPVAIDKGQVPLVSQVNFSGMSYRMVAERALPNWSPRVVASAHC